MLCASPKLQCLCMCHVDALCVSMFYTGILVTLNLSITLYWHTLPKDHLFSMLLFMFLVNIIIKPYYLGISHTIQGYNLQYWIIMPTLTVTKPKTRMVR